LQAAGVGQAGHDDYGILAGEAAGGLDRFVQGADLAQEALAAAELRGAAAEASIDHEEVAAAVELEEFDPAADEVGQRGLAGVAGGVLGKGEIALGEDAKTCGLRQPGVFSNSSLVRTMS
jgi:hypothetical protein